MIIAATAILRSRNIAISLRWLELGLSPRNLARWRSLTLLTIPFRKSAPVYSCTFWLVYALDVSCSFSETFAVQNDKRTYLNLAIKQQIYMLKKLQFMHTVNGDGSKTAKIIKSTINHTNIDIQAMLVWLIVPFKWFLRFLSVAVITMCINCSFYVCICCFTARLK